MVDRKKLVEGFFKDVFNARSADALGGFLADGYVEHDPFPGLPNDAEGAKQSIQMLFAAFPDLDAKINFMFGEDDLVAVHSMFSGTHQGDFFGIPATGKKVQVNALDIVKINDDGKAVEHWGLVDTGALMAQLGMMPGA